MAAGTNTVIINLLCQRHRAPQVGDQVLNNDCYVISFSVHCTEEGDRRVPTLQALKQENLPFLWCPG